MEKIKFLIPTSHVKKGLKDFDNPTSMYQEGQIRAGLSFLKDVVDFGQRQMDYIRMRKENKGGKSCEY